MSISQVKPQKSEKPRVGPLTEQGPGQLSGIADVVINLNFKTLFIFAVGYSNRKSPFALLPASLGLTLV